jgi:preprotein translocase subunit SecG
MLSLLLIIIDIIVGICLVAVVLMQRSEGGAFGMGGGPTGMISARGAGDLLTRTTWVLFSVFLVLSLGLTLLGAHDRSTSSVLQQLKGQIANPAALSQPTNTAPAGPPPGPSAPAPAPFLAPGATNPLSAPAPQSAAPITAPAPSPVTAPSVPTAAAPARPHEHKAAAAAPAPAVPTLEAPAPSPVTPAPAPATQP